MPTTKTNNSQHETHLESTVEAIEEHVEKKATTGVTATISSWIKTLDSHDDLKPIAKDLENLKKALADKDGAKIVDLMTKLGEATTEAAESAEGKEATKIKRLGKALTVAAKAIAKLT